MRAEEPMPTTSPTKRLAGRAPAPTRGPQIAFFAAVLTAFGALALSAATLPQDLVMPAVSTLFFILAALVGVVAWAHGRMAPDALTYWDVTGALTLIGICVAATVDPEQMVRLIEGTHREP